MIHANPKGELAQALRDGSRLRLYKANNQDNLTLALTVELPSESVPEVLHARLHDISRFLCSMQSASHGR